MKTHPYTATKCNANAVVLKSICYHSPNQNGTLSAPADWDEQRRHSSTSIHVHPQPSHTPFFRFRQEYHGDNKRVWKQYGRVSAGISRNQSGCASQPCNRLRLSCRLSPPCASAIPATQFRTNCRCAHAHLSCVQR